MSIGYSVQGNLIGHISIGVGMLREALADSPISPRTLRVELEHLILSHHGAKELGSPVVPMTVEAFILAATDDLDAKLHQVRRLIADDDSDGPFTTYNRRLERVIFKPGPRERRSHRVCGRSPRSEPTQIRRAWIAWSAICVIWGTTYLAIKVGLETIPPFLHRRNSLHHRRRRALPRAAARGRRLPPVADWGRLAVLGFFMLLLGNGGVVWGEQFVPSGLTAVLIGTSPFWMVSVDAMMQRGRQLHVREWTGLVLGFAGIVLLVWPDITQGGTGGRGFAFGVISLQLACAGWAVGSSYTRRHVMPNDVLGSAAMQMLFGGLFLLAAGTAVGEWGRLSFNPRTLTALAYLTVAGSVIAFAAYSYALQHLDVAVVSLYTYVNPVIAVLLGTLFLGEPFGMRMVVSAAIIVLGVVIVGPRRKG